MAEVILKNVDKVYEGNVKVVDDLNLHIQDGEFIVLVGPSGCGKSTTLRMIAGLEDITGGTIQIGSRIVNDVSPKDRDIAMVFQSYALYPHMTVFENMGFALKLRKLPKAEIEKKVRRAADILGIVPLLDRKPKALSGGQRQRVALGRAIVREPKCFLFDEPLSNLDARLRVEMRVEIKRLHLELGSTTVYVTHDQEEAITLGDRVVVMKDGIVHQCAPALEIYRRPANRFVADFLGNPPMNFLAGRLEAAGERLWFVEAGGNGDVATPGRDARVPVPAWAIAPLQARVGHEVVLGIRPEALSDRDHARFATSDNVLGTRVRLVQMLGNRMDVHVATGGHANVVAQLDSFAGLQVGQALTLFFDPDRVHFFEPGPNGRALASPGAPGVAT